MAFHYCCHGSDSHYLLPELLQQHPLWICSFRSILHTASRVLYLKARSDHLTPQLEALEWFCRRYKIISKILDPLPITCPLQFPKYTTILYVSMTLTIISSSYNACSHLVFLVNTCLDCSGHHLLFKTFSHSLSLLFSSPISVFCTYFYNCMKLCCNYLLICLLPFIDCKYVKVPAMLFVSLSISSAMQWTQPIVSRQRRKKNLFFSRPKNKNSQRKTLINFNIFILK